ncbi:MAG: type 1 glutamine amidotransferase [Thermodesulfobacteriota bacterium]|nr:type 1 glutamine amidotransferase [Thermodesulfobacteriota bacterium]
MSILFVQHVENEGPGNFKRVLDEQEVPFQILKTFSSVKFDLPSDCSGVIILGGPMNVDDESDYPFLREEKDFIKELIRQETPLLGICLGAQLIAQAAGGEVFKADKKEIGWYEVSLSTEGEDDLIVKGLPKVFQVFQWHEDTFSIPPQGKRLITAAGCPNQGFKVGTRCYGIQFHLEADAEMIDGWLQSALGDLPSNHIGIIQKETEEKEPECLMWGKKFLLNFLELSKQLPPG